MMNFDQVNDKITKNGFRRHAGTRTNYVEETNTTQKVYDYEHRKKLDMFSVYANEFGSVEYIEYTQVGFNPDTRKYSQKVTTINNIADLNKILA